MKNLIMYYSYGGNTEKIALLLQKEINADIMRIETQIPYTGSYQDIVEQGQNEINSGYMPKLKNIALDLTAYNAVFLGTPVWWYTYAPAIKTLFAQQDFQAKKIHPFVTNGGWIGHTFKDIEKNCQHADIQTGINIRFEEHTLVTPVQEIQAWAQKASSIL